MRRIILIYRISVLFRRIVLSSAAILTGCASVSDLVTYVTPDVSLADAHFDKLSFESITLLFDMEISNPNPIGVTLSAFDYDFSLDGNSFVKGQQDQRLEIEASGNSTVPIPITVGFSELYRTFTSLRSQDSSNYKLDVNLAFDLPVVGVRKLPISAQGTLPMLKLPGISLASLKIIKLGITGADLSANLRFNNPNAVSFTVSALDYKLDINQQPWVDGSLVENLDIAAKEETEIAIPVSLNFLQIGQSAYQLLSGDEALSYHITGSAALRSSLPSLGEVSLPFEHRGKVSIRR